MSSWIKTASATAVGRLVAWLIISLLTATGSGLAIIKSWEYLESAPLPIWFLIGVGVFSVLFFFIYIGYRILNLPIGPGIYGSKYLYWYRNPLRKISWKFEQFLGGTSAEGHPVTITSFQVALKVNRGEGVTPKKAYIENKKIGVFENVLIKKHNKYEIVERIDFIPSDQWFSCQITFGGMTKEQFLKRYNSFKFVFEYDNKLFSKKFTRNEIETWIDRYWYYNNRG